MQAKQPKTWEKRLRSSVSALVLCCLLPCASLAEIAPSDMTGAGIVPVTLTPPTSSPLPWLVKEAHATDVITPPDAAPRKALAPQARRHAAKKKKRHFHARLAKKKTTVAMATKPVLMLRPPQAPNPDAEPQAVIARKEEEPVVVAQAEAIKLIPPNVLPWLVDAESNVPVAAQVQFVAEAAPLPQEPVPVAEVAVPTKTILAKVEVATDEKIVSSSGEVISENKALAEMAPAAGEPTELMPLTTSQPEVAATTTSLPKIELPAAPAPTASAAPAKVELLPLPTPASTSTPALKLNLPAAVPPETQSPASVPALTLPVKPPVVKLNVVATVPPETQIPAPAPTIAPTPVPTVPVKPSPTPAPVKQAPVLSQESKDVLDRLPPEPAFRPDKNRKVKLEHSHKGEEKDEVKKRETYGMKIAVKKPKMDVFRSLEAAYNALIAGDQQYAITLYKEVLDEDPENTLALFGLATTYHRAGQLQLARPLYAQLLEIDPHNVEGLNNFLVLLADEAPDQALAELEKLQRSHPSFSPVSAQMALIYQKKGEYAKAAEKMARALAVSPENLKYQYNMAIIYDKMGDWPEAAKWYQRLISAEERGEKIPGNSKELQQRLTFIRSNTSSAQ